MEWWNHPHGKLVLLDGPRSNHQAEIWYHAHGKFGGLWSVQRIRHFHFDTEDQAKAFCEALPAFARAMGAKG